MRPFEWMMRIWANGILGSVDGSDDPGPTPFNAIGVLSHNFGSNGGGTVLLLGDGAPAELPMCSTPPARS